MEIIPGFTTIYFLGIGGVHMSAMAELLSLAGHSVTGSDARKGAATDRLTDFGIKVYIGPHKAENIGEDVQLLVYTAAVNENNPELTEAKRRGICVVSRGDLLGRILSAYGCSVCVSGTHGKTSTTTMLDEIFVAAGKRPTTIAGERLKATDSALRPGGMEFTIAEACEYHDSFLGLSPGIGLVLNIEADHLDYFGDLSAIRASFRKFAGKISKTLVIGTDIPKLHEITNGLSCAVRTFGIGEGTYNARGLSYNDDGCASFTVTMDGETLAAVSLRVPGRINVKNAMAAFAAAHSAGLSPSDISRGLHAYAGAKRRFELKGTYNGARVYDDYAHHPTELRAALEAARGVKADKTYFIFQPHTHSRTKSLLQDFADVLKDAREVIIMDIYSPAGREEPDTHIHSRDLCRRVEDLGGKALYFPTFGDCAGYLRSVLKEGDLMMTIGAGDGNKIGEMVLGD